jgi:PPOX class probable F420-dependent enzyme
VRRARIARLATVGADGRPHLVPVCIAVLGDTAYTGVDHKPKRSTRLRRIANLERNGLACLLVDAYSEDWSSLWWVRLDGRGRVVDDADEAARAVAELRRKYEQYDARPPSGPVIAIDIERWVAWSAA